MKFFAFESKAAPLAPFRLFAGRLAKSFLLTVVVVAVSLAFGTVGYHEFGGCDWIDALYNAAMILTGMGPVNPMTTTPGKLFGTAYALYSGVVFIGMAGIILAPVYHRLIHKFHLEDAEDADGVPDAREGK